MFKLTTPKIIVYYLIAHFLSFIAFANSSNQSNLVAQQLQRDVTFINTLQSEPLANSRLALVIGNSNYQNIGALNNPINDAQDMTEILTRLGFQVLHQQNSSNRSMAEAVESFGEHLKQNKGVGLFYYAGHGVQIEGKNYLMPVDAKINKPSDIQFEALDLAKVLETMANANNRLNIVILDACRNNPYSSSFRSISSGLAQVSAPSGTLLAYATAPGNVAADGNGRNGIYTQNLLNNIETPNLSIEALFKRVRQGVMLDTEQRQVPWESSSLIGDFYFANSDSNSTDLCKLTQINQRPINCLFKDY